ncbi:MAG: hypothetical protein KDB27_28265 [Planctomycetales bacterium]|nr:hypothetical protein [Planctomycetales bacterium]
MTNSPKYATENPRKAALGLAIVDGLCGFLGASGTSKSLFMTFFSVLPIVGSTIVVTAAWSALGVGNVTRRLILSHWLAAIVLVATGAGLIVDDGLPVRHDDLLYFAMHAICLYPSVSVSSQFVFWSLRAAFGFQLQTAITGFQPALILRDFFAITTLVAIAGAGLKASQLLQHQDWAGLNVPQNIKQNWDEQILVMFATTCGHTFAGTLSTLPVFFLAMTPVNRFRPALVAVGLIGLPIFLCSGCAAADRTRGRVAAGRPLLRKRR